MRANSARLGLFAYDNQGGTILSLDRFFLPHLGQWVTLRSANHLALQPQTKYHFITLEWVGVPPRPSPVRLDAGFARPFVRLLSISAASFTP